MKRFVLVLLVAVALLGACDSGEEASAPEPTPPLTSAPEQTTSGTQTATTVPASATSASSDPAQRVTLAWVSMDTDQTGWAATIAGELVRTADGGATWQFAGPADQLNPDAAIYTDGTFAWIAQPSESGLVIWRTDTSGTTWDSVEVARDPAAGVFIPHDLVFPDPLHGWLLVQLDGAAGTVFVDLYRTADGGTTWDKVAGPPPSEANAALESGHSLDMDFNSAGRGWVTKDIGAAPGARIAGTADGGATWRELTIPQLASEVCATRDPYSRDVLGGSVLVECADGSAWFAQTPDDGVTWELFAMPEPATQAFRFEDGALAWGASLMEWLGPPEEFQIVSTFPAPPASVSVPDAVHVFAVVGGELWRSEDQGRTWSTIEPVLGGA